MTPTRWMLIGAVCLLSVILEWFVRHTGHALPWWHLTPAFDLAYGFSGCVAIVLISKWIGHVWLQQPEDYYEGDTHE